MPDNDHPPPDAGQPQDGSSADPGGQAVNPEMPASVIFMEMMRQQAARTPSRPPSAVDEGQPDPDAPEMSSPEDARRHRAAALKSQRVQRVQRRKERSRHRTVGALGGFIRTILVVGISAGLMATIFTWWTDPRFLDSSIRADLQVALATSQATTVPTPMPTPNWLRRVGIVSGHRGPFYDPGAVCPDGLTENEINFAVAQQVVRLLRQRGFSVDLLDEFDPRLDDYQSAALVSIHANTCQDFGEVVSGYLVAQASARPEGGEDERLAECVAFHYGQATGLERRFNLTRDMTEYHTFGEIHQLTPAAIVELGFMFNDRELLTGDQEAIASGLVEGVLCFLEGRQIEPTATPEQLEDDISEPTG